MMMGLAWLQLFELQNKQQAVRLCWSWLSGPGLHWHASAAMLSLGLLSADCSRVVAGKWGHGSTLRMLSQAKSSHDSGAAGTTAASCT